MKYIRFILIGFIVFLFNGCVAEKNANYFAYKNDLEGFKNYHKTTGNRYTSSKSSGLIGAVDQSLSNSYLDNKKKNYKIIEYLLENGANVKNVKYKFSYYDDRKFDLFNYSLLSKNTDVIKILMDYGITINNFDLPYIKISFTGEILYNDRGTSCRFKQYICNNQIFAKKYYEELQLKKQQSKQKLINKKKNDEIDNLLGI